MTEKEFNKKALDLAQKYADNHSTCCKVKVGSIIIIPHTCVFIHGCNHGVHNCIENGCRRVKLYGNASKEHRLPSDCDAIHSEIDAISKAANTGMKLKGATIYVSRYPCENCARAIAASGIEKVIYGRQESISDYTKQILDAAGVVTEKITDWDWEDNYE